MPVTDRRLTVHRIAKLKMSRNAVRKLAPPCHSKNEADDHLSGVRERSALRAGLMSEAISRSAGDLRGFVDRVTPHVIEGWAQNTDHPEAPVCLDVLVGGRLIGQVLANRYREDLKHASIGSGSHSFSFAPPDGLAFAPNAVEVRRSLDGAVLPVSAQARRNGASAAA